MYDMYPEWGPAARHAERPLHVARRAHRHWEPQPSVAPDQRDPSLDRPADDEARRP